VSKTIDTVRATANKIALASFDGDRNESDFLTLAKQLHHRVEINVFTVQPPYASAILSPISSSMTASA